MNPSEQAQQYFEFYHPLAHSRSSVKGQIISFPTGYYPDMGEPARCPSNYHNFLSTAASSVLIYVHPKNQLLDALLRGEHPTISHTDGNS